VLGGRLVARWTDRQVVLNDELALGYGWNIYTTPYGRLVAHVGGNAGFASAVGWMPERRFFYYVHGNNSYWPAESLEEPLLQAAFDSSFRMPPLVPGASGNASVAVARAGEYTTGRHAAEGFAAVGPMAGDAHIRFRTDDVRLVATLSGQAMLDAVLSPSAADRQRFALLHERAATLLSRLIEGRDDALDGIALPAPDLADRSKRLLALVTRDGAPRSSAIIGTMHNADGTRFGGQGGASTLIRMDYESGTRVLHLLWRDDGSYRGAAMGSLRDVPAFTLVPVGADEYVGVERSAPWRTQRFRFSQDCVLMGELRACRPR
jgi:hypothetical protein